MQKNLTQGSRVLLPENIGGRCGTITNKIWLSYIIPLYNCGEYIAKCLDSVLAQGVEPNEYEVIVINDGSTDNGAETVTQYCQKHGNFRLINKENGGVSSARNRGLDEAKGEYVFFVDADDYLLPYGMKTLRDCYLNKYGHADMVSFRFYTVDKFYNFQEWGNVHPHHSYFQGTFLEYGNRYGISPVIYTQIISHKLITDCRVRFQPYVMVEDTLFMITLFKIATQSTIIATDLNIYRYCVRNNSAMSSEARKHTKRVFYDLLNMASHLNTIQNHSLYNKEIFKQRIIYCQAQAFVRICHSSFSYSEIKTMLNDASNAKFYPIEEPISHAHKFINKTYNHPFIVYLFSLVFRYVYLPIIKPMGIHSLYVKYLTSHTK